MHWNWNNLLSIRPFPRLASNAFPDVGSVGRIEKKNHKKSRNMRPWYPRKALKVNTHIFGLTKCTIYCKKCSCFCSCFSPFFYYAIFQIKRIISSEKWLSQTTSSLFGRTTLNGEKKEDGLMDHESGREYNLH